MFQEFKNFAIKGNVMDMAIGVIIGGAFGKIVSSLVSDIIMPPIGMILGQMDFSELSLVLQKATEEEPAITLNYGAFINNILDFLIIAFSIFLVIKQLNRLKKKESEAPAKPAEPSEEVQLLREIRDTLKKKECVK